MQSEIERYKIFKDQKYSPHSMCWFCLFCENFLQSVCLLNGALENSRSSLVFKIRNNFIFRMLYQRKKEESQRKVWEFDRLSEETPWVQLDDLSLCQSALPRSLGKFPEISEKSGKIENWKEWPPYERDTPLSFMTFYTTRWCEK